MIRRLPKSPRTATLFPSTTLFRSQRHASRRASPRRGRQRAVAGRRRHGRAIPCLRRRRRAGGGDPAGLLGGGACHHPDEVLAVLCCAPRRPPACAPGDCAAARSEEHTSELQSLMRISYAVFCLKKKTSTNLRHSCVRSITLIT